MIEITDKKQNTLYYSCDCGAKGICSFRPAKQSSAIVISIECPACKEMERVTLLQYDDEESKKNILENLNSVDLSWVPYINEEILSGSGE